MGHKLSSTVRCGVVRDAVLGVDVHEMNRSMRSSELMVLTVGMKMPCLERQSTTTRIAVKPLERGNCLMKSIDIESQGCSSAGRGFRKL